MPYDFLSYQNVPNLSSMEEVKKSPSLLPALGTNLIGALLGGVLGALEGSAQRRYKQRMANKLESKLKPGQPYYESEDLAGYDEALRKIIMGNLANKFGGDALAKWGLF